MYYNPDMYRGIRTPVRAFITDYPVDPDKFLRRKPYVRSVMPSLRAAGELNTQGCTALWGETDTGTSCVVYNLAVPTANTSYLTTAIQRINNTQWCQRSRFDLYVDNHRFMLSTGLGAAPTFINVVTNNVHFAMFVTSILCSRQESVFDPAAYTLMGQPSGITDF